MAVRGRLYNPVARREATNVAHSPSARPPDRLRSRMTRARRSPRPTDTVSAADRPTSRAAGASHGDPRQNSRGAGEERRGGAAHPYRLERGSPALAKSGDPYKAGTDPIEILKSISFDGKGRGDRRHRARRSDAALCEDHARACDALRMARLSRAPSPPPMRTKRARDGPACASPISRGQHAEGRPARHAHRHRVGRRVALLLERD